MLLTIIAEDVVEKNITHFEVTPNGFMYDEKDGPAQQPLPSDANFRIDE